MTYRDDRDALRSEVDTLHEELAKAREEQERLRSVAERLEAAKRELAAAEAALGEARKPRQPGMVLAIALGIAAMGIVAGFLSISSRAAPPPQTIAATTPLPELAAPPPGPVRPTLPAQTTAPTPAMPLRTAHATWTARVSSASGVGLKPGASCAIEADVVPDKTGMHAEDVVVKCGAAVVYDENGKLEGMSMLDSSAKERVASAGSEVYELAFSDVGQRAATRNQAKLDSQKKLGKVWSENLPELRIDLVIDPESAPVRGAPLGETSPRDNFDR